MADIFLHLAAQSLGGMVGVQPLIASLFAPAPQLVSDTALPVSHEQPAGETEPDSFSIVPASFASEMTEPPEMEPPSEEIAPPVKRAILSDLVPPGVPRNAVSILSLRHLLQPRPLVYEEMERLSPASLPLAPAPISEEPGLQDTQSPALPQVQSEQKNRNTQAERVPAQPSHFPSLPLISPLPAQAQEGALPGVLFESAEEMPPSFVSDDNQQQAHENSFRATPAQRAPQHPSPENQPAISMDTTFPLLNVLPTADSHVAPLAAPFVSTQPLIQPEQSMKRDKVTDQQFSSLVQPAGIPEPPKSHKEEHEHTGKPAYQPSLRAGETTIEPLLDQPALAQEPQPPLSHLAMPTSVMPAPVVPVAVSQGALHSGRVSPKQEAAVAQVEEEASPIRITIGRVVVRATAAAQPAPTQKRVLRPAQSLGEYLKQRERGSR